MELIYTFFISFIIVFFSELGDKTQLLVLSFSTKNKTKNILIGVALGSFFSHGLSILFGSKLASSFNEDFLFYLKLITYISFILFGIIGFLPKKEKLNYNKNSKPSFLQKITNMNLNCIFIVAFCIIIGELGDKTFLASLGLGLEYPNYKITLISGSISGMIASNAIAIYFGKLLNKYINQKYIEILANLIFILFGLICIIFAL